MAHFNQETRVQPTSVNESDPVLKEAREMLLSGWNLVKVDHDSGISKFSEALALMVKNFGELDVKNLIYYIEYGKALLAQGDVLTNTLKHLEQELDQEKEQSEEKGFEEPAKEVHDVNPLMVQTETGAVKSGQELTNGTARRFYEEQNRANGEADTVADDRELARQLFEIARVIITNNEEMDEKEKSLQMGNVHHSLGEVALGEGNFDQGYEEFTTSFQLLGKCLKLSDPRIGRAQQLAGLCAVHEGHLEAAQFHYTAAAENYNMRLEELLVGAGVLEAKNPDEPESEHIDFVDMKYLDILKARVGEQSDLFKKSLKIFNIVNDLIVRVEELMEEEEQKKAEVVKVMQLLEQKMKNGDIPGVKSLNAEGYDVVECKSSGQVVTEQYGFDNSLQSVTAEVEKLGTFGGKVKRLSFTGQSQEVVGSPLKKVKSM